MAERMASGPRFEENDLVPGPPSSLQYSVNRVIGQAVVNKQERPHHSDEAFLESGDITEQPK